MQFGTAGRVADAYTRLTFSENAKTRLFIARSLRTARPWTSPIATPDAMPHVNLRSPVGRVIAALAARLRAYWHREDVPGKVQIAPPAEARPTVPAAYMPLYTYLDRRYADTVVLTFEQIEDLLGFAPPSPAFADAGWWTGASGGNDRHTAAWTAARRRAAPRLSARVVAFERLP